MTRPPASRLTYVRLTARFALLALLFFATRAESQTFDDPGFAAQTVTTVAPFQVDGIRFAPDGTMFIAQKNGVIRTFRDGVLRSTPFIDLSSQVNTVDDRGLIGLALDPGFAENGYVYLGFVYEPGGNTNDTGPKTSRLVRVTANPANRDVALAGSMVIILDGFPANGTSHTLDTIRFAPDGTMFVSNGDGTTQATQADPPALDALNIDSLRGKIIRINPDGSAPSPPQLLNPFYDGTDSIRSKVWAYGLRNPYRFDIYSVTGELYTNDTGWNTWEELDRIIPGRNYGWPCFEGPLPQPGYQSTFPAVCGGLPQSATQTPLVTYDRSVGSAAVGGCFYTGAVYPTQYRNNFFWSDYTGNFIRRLVLDASGALVSNVRFATNVGAPTAMEVGPDGLLYVADFISGNIKRIVFNGPTAIASATPTSGYSPLAVNFSSAGSGDGLGRPVTYLWNFGDGQTSTQANPQHTYTSGTVQTFNAQLTVTNNASQSASTVVPVVVGSLPPVPVITAPTGGVGVEPGATVNYAGSATDPDQGALGAGALSWTILLHHNTHVHRSSGSTGPTGSFVAQEHGVGTYSYELQLTATDASGLKATATVTVPVLPDSIPPTAPSGLTATQLGPNAINLSWTAATDNGAVDNYPIERCSGVGCSNFVQIATAPETSYVDIALTPATSYTYRVRAADTNGNLGPYSNTATAVTAPANQNPPGLVAAYNFDTGSGAVLADLSGNGNHGGVNGATWVAGHTGNALQFDGVSNVVVVNDSASLDLSTAMTLEAWVRPTQTLSNWKSIMQKQVDAWYLNANTAGNHVGGGAVFNAACCTTVESSTGLAPNQWTHVALTYDGANLRIYVNGVQAGILPRTGTIEVNNNPLRIGGNTYSSEFFPGTIDDVRIYNRALSAAEVAQDMATPVGGAPAPDTTPPARSAGAPTGVQPVGTTQVTLSLTTDESATCRYGTTPNTAYASLPNTFATTGGTSHSTTAAGLANGQSYTFYVRCQDTAGNANTNDFNISFSVAADTTPPTRSAGSPSGVLPVGTTQTVLSLATNEAATCRYGTVVNTPYASLPNVFSTTGGTTHSTVVAGLANGTSYSYFVRCQDGAGNANTNDFTIAFSVAAVADTTPPVRSNGAPSGVQPVGTTQVTLSLATNENATCRYGTTPNTVYGSLPNAFSTTGATSHSSVVTGLVNGQSYNYYVRCQDPSLNANTDDFAIAFSVAADTTAPTVSVTAPAAGDVSGTISVTATAADNVGVAGVQFLLDGANLGAEDTTSPYSVSWNTTTATNGTHSLTARARDAANNTTTSAGVSVNVNNAPPSGPVAAYNFDAGSGGSLADLSGNSNTGTISGATWAAGHTGQALSFNGTSNVVVINDSPSLDLSTAMTLEAWVRPSQTLNNWKGVLQKQVDAYFLNANTNNNRVGSGGTFGGNCCTVVEGTSGLAPNVWTHLASTYDGTTLRIYLNGTQVGSVPQTGAIEVNGNPLRIGGSTYSNEFFAGLIDDLRIYNRALTPAEITTDMNTPVGGGPPDTTPPVLSAGTPTGTLPAGTIQTSIGVTTNEAATCRWGTVAGTPYASLPNVFGTTGATTHATLVGGLTNGQTFTYYVRCSDVAGNPTTSDFTITFSVASDTTPPIRSSGAPQGVLPVGTTAATLSLTTSEAATCRYGTVANTAYASLPTAFTTTGGTTHSTSVPVANGQSYTFYVRCRDAANNANPDDFAISFSVAADTTPPTLSSGSPSGVLPVGTTQTVLSLATNEAATCRYGTVAGTPYASLPNAFSTTGGTTHSTIVAGLANGTGYSFVVRCQDPAGNATTTDFTISFAVAAAPDTTPPVRSAGAPSGALPFGTTQATLSLATSENATCRYGTVANTAYASLPTAFSTTGGTSHSTNVTGLTSGQSYTFYVRCQDQSSNANPDDFAIAFSVAADTTPPTVSLTAPAAGTVSGTVTLTASASDAGGVAGVQFLLDGAALGVEDTTSPYSLDWNSATASNAAHTLAARARDSAGNLTTSTGVSVTVDNSGPGPSGPVAAYSFNAGTGATLADSSGNGNTGSINGPIWSGQGHTAGALQFDGVNDVVFVNDSASLDVSTGMTLEAWVRPSQILNNWKAVLQKEVDAYFLNANTAGNRVGSGGTFDGACCSVVEGPSGLTPNVWTHLASTYDGAFIRLYVNGVQVAQLARTGAIETNASPLRIGGTTYPNEFFAGLMDDLRIYNRALSAAEIQQDMVTPVSP